MKWFDTVILILSLYNIIYDGYFYLKLPNYNSHNNIKASHKDKPLNIVIRTISILLYLSLLILIIWSDLFPNGFIIFFCLIPGGLMYFYNALNASNSLKEVLINENENLNLKFRDKYNIDIIVITIINLKLYIPVSRIIDNILNQSWGKIHIEIALTIIIFLYAFVFTLLFVVELIVPLNHIKRILELIKKCTNKACNYVINDLKDKNIDKFIKADYTYRVLRSFPRQTLIIKALYVLFAIPLFFVIDLIIGFFKCLYIIFVLVNIALLLGIIIYIEKFILYILEFVTNIPGRRVVKNTFKLSGIIAATIVIIILKLSLLYSFDENYIGIIEFIASAIIIPMIFEWVYSNQNEKKAEIQNTQKHIVND